MSDAPGSPKAARLASPGWLDTRLVLGVLLVLVSVVAGARILGSADATVTVYAASRSVEPGTVLAADDFTPTRVRVDGAGLDRLVGPDADGTPPDGYVALRAIEAGDLVLRSQLVEDERTELRQFTLNVEPGHAPPDLGAGDVVDVYVTPRTDGGQPAPAATPGADGALTAADVRRVLTRVVVGAVGSSESFGGGEAVPVVLNLTEAQVLVMVRAVAEGQVDLVRQVGQEPSDATLPTRTPAPASATPTAG